MPPIGKKYCSQLKLPKLSITLLKWFIKLDEQNCRFFDKKKKQIFVKARKKIENKNIFAITAHYKS